MDFLIAMGVVEFDDSDTPIVVDLAEYERLGVYDAGDVDLTDGGLK